MSPVDKPAPKVAHAKHKEQQHKPDDKNEGGENRYEDKIAQPFGFNIVGIDLLPAVVVFIKHELHVLLASFCSDSLFADSYTSD